MRCPSPLPLTEVHGLPEEGLTSTATPVRTRGGMPTLLLLGNWRERDGADYLQLSLDASNSLLTGLRESFELFFFF